MTNRCARKSKGRKVPNFSDRALNTTEGALIFAYPPPPENAPDLYLFIIWLFSVENVIIEGLARPLRIRTGIFIHFYNIIAQRLLEVCQWNLHRLLFWTLGIIYNSFRRDNSVSDFTAVPLKEQVFFNGEKMDNVLFECSRKLFRIKHFCKLFRPNKRLEFGLDYFFFQKWCPDEVTKSYEFNSFHN